MSTPRLTDTNSTFKYRAGGNAQDIWRKYGWTPPSEYREDYLFKQNREVTDVPSIARGN